MMTIGKAAIIYIMIISIIIAMLVAPEQEISFIYANF